MATYTAHYPPAQNDTYVKATSISSSSYPADNSTDPALSLIGSFISNSWTTSSITNQKFNVDLGEPLIIRRLRIDNFHHNGTQYLTTGIKNCIIYGTNSATAFASLTYNDLTDLVQLASFQVAQHAAANAADPQYFLIDNETAYRYYVIRIADNWGEATLMGLRHLELETEDGYTPGGGMDTFRNGLLMPWADADVYRSGLEMVWSYGFSPFRNGLGMHWREAFASGLKMPFNAAQKYRSGLAMWWRDSYILRNGLTMAWQDAKRHRGGLEMGWRGIEPYRNGLAMPFGVTADSYRSGLEMPFHVLERNVFRSGLSMIWFGGGKGADQQYTVGLTMAGQSFTMDGKELGASEIRVRRSRGEYMVTVTLAMAGDPDMLPGAVLPDDYAYLDAAAQAAAREAAEVVVTIGMGEDAETVRVLATSISDEVSVDGTDYTLTCESAAVLLDAPYALPINQEYGPAMASDIAIGLLAGFPFSLSWQVVDWWITGGVLYANGETPIEVLRKPKGAVGAKIQSDLDGNLAVTPYYDVSRKDWATANIAEHLPYGDNFFRHGRSPMDRADFNSFLIGDLLSSGNSLRYEEEDLDYGVKEVRGYVVPWSDSEIPLQTSGPDRVVIEASRVVVQTVEEELVEIVAGQGRTKYPIHEIISRDYGENDSLGAISYGEDGRITTEIAGQSLCLVSYRTKYWRWVVRDDVEEQVQLFSLPAWADMPVTLVVTFGDPQAAQGFVVAEPDDTLNVDSDGNVISELPPGQPFYFQLQHDTTIRLNSVAVSSGAVVKRGSVTREKKQQVQVIDKSGIELPYFPAGNIESSWYGRKPSITRNGREIKASVWPAIGEITYDAEMQSFVLNPPTLALEPEEKYYILITMKMVSV